MKPRTTCPGCGGIQLSPTWRIPRQPVVLNYRFATAAAALRVPRRDLRLAQCGGCGLIFNAVFDSAVIPYDECYENRQGCSAAFQAHLQAQVRRLVRRLPARDGRVLEVGCGKGDFLRLLCREAGARGVGYDTSYEGPPVAEDGRVRFEQHYVSAREVESPFDMVVCRHVVEHIGEIGSFLRELRAIAAAAGDPVVVIETPAFEWIAAHDCFWDVFYEHCNYFPRPSLARLCRLAGFKVERQTAVFGGQYQWLELRVRQRCWPACKAATVVRLSPFAKRAERMVQALEKRLRQHGAARGWAIWGAGAKGVALVNRLHRLPPALVVDSNAAKQGGFIPGSRVPIVAPDDPCLRDLSLVLIANPRYAPEITCALRQAGIAPTILTT
ncbi:MAG: methyltransferase domain-containing protein [Verrucomicrobia bacterium]|nr:methyltransferase domain-containing protein [Verrucomicrobiota bacterium]